MTKIKKMPAKKIKDKPVNQDQGGNFRGKNGKLYLVRCYACGDSDGRGRENWASAVATGQCAWCGWKEK